MKPDFFCKNGSKSILFMLKKGFLRFQINYKRQRKSIEGVSVGCTLKGLVVPTTRLLLLLFHFIDGFRKVAKPDQGGLTSIQDDSVEFWHTNFRRGHPELLPLVQRRVSEWMNPTSIT